MKVETPNYPKIDFCQKVKLYLRKSLFLKGFQTNLLKNEKTKNVIIRILQNTKYLKNIS